MNEELKETNMKNLPLIKTITSWVISIILTAGICYGVCLKVINDVENLKANDAKQDIVINQLTDQLNKGILEIGIITTELKNSNKNIEELKHNQEKAIELLIDIKNSRK